MKINKKTIIIIAIVAVAAYLLWKKGIFSKTVATASVVGGNASETTADTNNLEDVIAAAKISSSLAAYIREKYAQYENYQTGRDRIEEKAINNNLTYEQQFVLDMLYIKYYEEKNGQWKPKSDTAKATFAAIAARVKAM